LNVPNVKEGGGRLVRYQSIAADLRARIRDGEFPLGATLPRHRDLAVGYEASPATIGKAVARVAADGLVRTVPHVGTVVLYADRLTLRADRMDTHRLDESWVDLSVTEAPGPPPAGGPALAEAQGVTYRVGRHRVEQVATVWRVPGRIPTDWTQTVAVRLASREEVLVLGVPDRSPVLVIERTGLDGGDVVHRTEIVLSDRYQIHLPPLPP
jgi:DNA-binding GntR family transcriptional regulator